MISNELGLKEWQGYGIDSIKTFLSDVSYIVDGQSDVKDFVNKRPTFREALISTAYYRISPRKLKSK